MNVYLSIVKIRTVLKLFLIMEGPLTPCPSPSPVAMCLCLIYNNAGWLCLWFEHTVSLEIIVLKKIFYFKVVKLLVVAWFCSLSHFSKIILVDSISWLLSFIYCGIKLLKPFCLPWKLWNFKFIRYISPFQFNYINEV